MQWYGTGILLQMSSLGFFWRDNILLARQHFCQRDHIEVTFFLRRHWSHLETTLLTCCFLVAFRDDIAHNVVSWSHLEATKNLLSFFSMLWSHFETTRHFLVALWDDIAHSETTFETTLLTVRRHLRRQFLARRHLRRHFLVRRHWSHLEATMSSRQKMSLQTTFVVISLECCCCRFAFTTRGQYYFKSLTIPLTH